MAKKTKLSKVYWEAIYLTSTAMESSPTFDKPSPSTQTVYLTTDGLDRIKEIMGRPSVETPQNPRLPEQFANQEYKNPFVHPMSWKLSYNKEVEARMRDRERPGKLP
jgi:hypothetical protein